MLLTIFKIHVIISIICNIISNCIIYPLMESKLTKEGYIKQKDIRMSEYFFVLFVRGLVFFIPIVNLTTTFYHIFNLKGFYNELKEMYNSQIAVKGNEIIKDELNTDKERDNDEIIELTDLNIDVSKFEDLSEEEQVEYLRQMFKDNPDFLVNDNVKKSKGKTLVKEKHK